MGFLSFSKLDERNTYRLLLGFVCRKSGCNGLEVELAGGLVNLQILKECVEEERDIMFVMISTGEGTVFQPTLNFSLLHA